MFKSKIMCRYVSSCCALSIKHLKKNVENSIILVLGSFDAEIEIAIKIRLIAQPYRHPLAGERGDASRWSGGVCVHRFPQVVISGVNEPPGPSTTPDLLTDASCLFPFVVVFRGMWKKKEAETKTQLSEERNESHGHSLRYDSSETKCDA